MKFLITCDNCDCQFVTDGESRQTVQCQCPKCGGQMKVKLPDEHTKKSPATDTKRPVEEADSEKPRRRTGCGIAIGIFLGLFILVLAGTIYYSMTQHESTKPIEDPFAHAYDDTTGIDESFEEQTEQALDTVEQHIEELPTDTIDSISSAKAEMESAEAAEPTDESVENGEETKASGSTETTEPQSHTPQSHDAQVSTHQPAKENKNQ